MTESRCLTRMPVYDLETGRVVGRVRRLVIDPEERRVIGLVLGGRLGKEARCVPFRELNAVGEHAVTVRGVEAITPLSEQPEMLDVLRSRRRLYHAPVLTEGGRFLGDVDEFTVNPRNGRVEALYLSGGLIRDLFRGQAVLPAHVVVTIGEDAVIVRDQAVAFLEAPAREHEGRSSRREPGSEPGGPPDIRGQGAPPAEGHGRRLQAALTWWRGRRQSDARTGAEAAGDAPPNGVGNGAGNPTATPDGQPSGGAQEPPAPAGGAPS